MPLFQNSVLNKYLQELDNQQIETAYKIFISNFGNPEKQNNIRASKEEQYQEGFLNDLFVNVLGYTKNPEPNFNLTTEYKNEKDAKKADGAILKESKPIAIIELKGTDTIDLDTVEVQAFNYKNNQSNCKYIITSNFEKLRFYIENAIEYEEFNLFNLSIDRFSLLFLCLSKVKLLNDIPLTIKQASITQEENITKKLYSDYSTFRHLIYSNIVELNPQHDKLLLYKKTQKLLDRFLFIFFAEDRLLLPPNSIREILKQWDQLKELDNYIPLYDRYKKYFNYLFVGHKGKEHEIFAYNGGLFEPDEILDNIKIDDEILYKHTGILADYDYQTEVDVNILGHIFEHSLGEIEEVQAKLEGQVIEKNKTRRKKDGIFYTPKYITKYIVDNTLGALCDEKKELEINENEFSFEKRKTKRKELIIKLDTYRNWLLKLTICDPACGSGAFLNQALNYLIEEHKIIDELQAKISGASIVFPDIENKILENNLYGVDLNDESIEIAKLSLWLRTAHKGRKLTSLNKNIKCGNSLIDDSAIAGDKAFNWQKEFPNVFANGGFDVVIGNPPYVRVQQLDYQAVDFLKSHYTTALKRIDISLCFIELSKQLIKSDIGITSFITSNQFLTTEYGQAMRAFLLEDYRLTECVDFGDLPIFADALTYVSIFIFKKSKVNNFKYFNVDSILIAMSNNFGMPKIIDISKLTDANWSLKNAEISNIFSKAHLIYKEISEIGNTYYGIITGADSIFNFTSDKYQNSELEKDLFIPLLRAQNCSKYYCFETENYVLYPYKYENGKTILLTEEELLQKFPKAYQYLLSHKTELEGRKDSRSTFIGRTDWYCLTRFGQINVFKKEKIVTPGEVKEHKFCIDYSSAGYSGARVFAITIDDNKFDIKYVLCLLNSTLMKSFLQSFSSLKNGGFYSYSSNILNRVPILQISIETQHSFIEKADVILPKNEELQIIKTKFLKLLSSKYNDLKITNKLEDWTELDFKGFSKELEKQKIKISLAEQSEWIEYFEKEKAKAQGIKSVIEKTDKEIDNMVYKLYELSEVEIKIVEGK